MFPDRVPSLRRQQGFLIPLALFILVGLLALALAASRLTGQSATSATLEGLSTQAFYAAESGGQYAMHALFFGVGKGDGRSVTDSNCAGLGKTIVFSTGSAPGLKACDAVVSCESEAVADSNGVTTSFYTITSAGRCGSGEMTAERTVEISAFMQ